MRVTIETVTNGAVIEFEDVDGAPAKTVHEYGDDNREGLSAMLWGVLDIIGEAGSRHDRERVVIRREHGDKWECKDKECEICQQNS